MSTTPRQTPPLFSPAPAPRGRDLTALWLIALAITCAIALALQLYHFWPHMAETAQNLLGISATVAAIAAVAAQVYRDYPAKVRFLSALVGCLALTLSAPLAVWAIGSPKQPLLSALLAWAAYFGIRWVSAAKPRAQDANVTGILLALTALTRAHAAPFIILFYAGAVLADGVRVRSLVARSRVLVIPVIAYAGRTLFRYFHPTQWLPNFTYPREFTLHQALTGLQYDLHGAGSEFVFLLLAVIGAVALWIAGKKRQLIFLATICIGWFLYILLIGGDVFPAYRYFVPAIPLMGFLVAGCGLLTLAAPFRFSRARVILFLVLTLLVLTSDLFAGR